MRAKFVPAQGEQHPEPGRSIGLTGLREQEVRIVHPPQAHNTTVPKKDILVPIGPQDLKNVVHRRFVFEPAEFHGGKAAHPTVLMREQIAE